MKVVHKSSRISVNILARLLLISIRTYANLSKYRFVGGNSEGHVNICDTPRAIINEHEENESGNRKTEGA